MTGNRVKLRRFLLVVADAARLLREASVWETRKILPVVLTRLHDAAKDAAEELLEQGGTS